jgi:hypothetical protein
VLPEQLAFSVRPRSVLSSEHKPFGRFKSPLETICFPFSLRNLEDLLDERGIDLGN